MKGIGPGPYEPNNSPWVEVEVKYLSVCPGGVLHLVGSFPQDCGTANADSNTIIRLCGTATTPLKVAEAVLIAPGGSVVMAAVPPDSHATLRVVDFFIQPSANPKTQG